MNTDILIVVDMQNDFIDGSLGSIEAQNIIKTATDFISSFDGEIIFTMDSHDKNYLNTNEGRHLSVPHCQINTSGYDLHKEIKKFVNPETKIFKKDRFSSLDLLEYIKNKNTIPTNIYLLGLCTDICVISNALLLKSFFSETNIYVLQNACAGSTIERHRAALLIMQSCHIDII